ncbi:hypothetical protein ACFVZT_18385 [Streptomyces sp. NPDC058321]|uniref:hypothetical protein n=1 Tax=Streptomyces sp. NPDC058321 TaxID=3346445 RepID=UPI0036EE9D16
MNLVRLSGSSVERFAEGSDACGRRRPGASCGAGWACGLAEVSAHVVDLGCGAGALFGQWAAAGAFACGVDQGGDGFGAGQVPEVVVEVDAVQAQGADALAVDGADAP